MSASDNSAAKVRNFPVKHSGDAEVTPLHEAPNAEAPAHAEAPQAPRQATQRYRFGGERPDIVGIARRLRG